MKWQNSIRKLRKERLLVIEGDHILSSRIIKMARKRNKNKRNFAYYLKFKNLSDEIQSYHATISMKQTLLWYLAYIGVNVAIGLILRMRFFSIGAVCLCSVFFVPFLMINTYKNAYEQRRFSDISQYMQQIIYSFRGTGKIKTSLENVREMYNDESNMRHVLTKALVKLDDPDTEGNPTREALRLIEAQYPCERVRTIHNFLMKIEEVGGDFNQTLDVLLDDRTAWVNRVTLLQANKKQKKTEVMFSIILSLILCFFMNTLMPKDVDITSSIIYQGAAVVMMVFDMAVYVAADKKLATDWLSQKEIILTETTKKNYEYVTTYDKAAERRKSVKFLVIPAVLAVIGVVAKIIPLMIIAAILTPILLFQHTINYRLSMKELRQEIKLKFPRWLMDLTMILQSTKNVQEAIFESIKTAPIVLVPELNKFRQELRNDPVSPHPYFNFMKQFNIPEIQASMNMFYSLSQGNGGDEQRQISEIITRNQKLLDKAEIEADENSLAMMYMDFLLPQISLGFMILVDMVLYIFMFLPNISQMV